jgi:polar amino acid transport system substrate-binding protein
MGRVMLTRRIAALVIIAFVSAVGWATAAQAGLVDEIKGRGTLLVGVEGKAYGGFMQTPGDGKLVGHDPDLSGLIAKQLGVKLELVDTAWAGIVPALYAKRFDMILGGMTITKARSERVNFSIPYADGSHILLTLANSPIKEVNDLSGKTVASQLGSASLNFLKALEGELKKNGKPGFAATKEYENFPEATLDLDNARIDGLLIPKPVALEFMGKKPGRFEIAIQFPDKRYFGAAIRKEDVDLLKVVNAVIKKAKADGTLKDLEIKWFGAPMGDLPDSFTPTE